MQSNCLHPGAMSTMCQIQLWHVNCLMWSVSFTM